MENDDTVKCNWCDWSGDEDDLKLIKEQHPYLKDESIFTKVCPNCLTDNYLMDINGKTK